MGLLPRSKAPSHHSGDGKPSSNTWMKAFIIVMCCLNAYYVLSSLHPSCAPARQLLSSTGQAAEAAAVLEEAGSTEQLFSERQELQEQLQEPQQQDDDQAQPAAALLAASSCAVKVEDVSSWASAGLTEGPFVFPKIIHQTVEDKGNVSCEALACMQTWMDMNPGYEHRLVDAAERHQFVATYYPEVRRIREHTQCTHRQANIMHA